MSKPLKELLTEVEDRFTEMWKDTQELAEEKDTLKQEVDELENACADKDWQIEAFENFISRLSVKLNSLWQAYFSKEIKGEISPEALKVVEEIKALRGEVNSFIKENEDD